MKRLIALSLSLCMVGTMLAACSSSQDTAQEDGPVTITIWHDKEDEVAAALQAELDQLAPDIVVNLERKDGLTDSLKMVGNDPNAAPDMYFFAHDKIGVYAEMGILAPITDFIDEETLNQYLPMTIEAATYKGEVYQLPLYFETLLFMYNRLYMSDDEVPQTTEELYSYMQETTQGGHYGFVEQHSTAYYAAGWLHAFDGYILNEAGEPGLNDPNTIKALEYHKKFVELMPTEGEYATVNTLFREGKAHSTIGGPWLVPTAREAGIDLGIAPMPTVDETGKQIAPYSGVQGIQVLKVAAERKHDAIAKVLEVLTGDQIGISIAQASGCAPAKESCYDDPTVSQDDMVMAMYETAQNAVPMPNVPEMDVMWTVAENLLVDVNMNGADVQTSADAAQQQALDLIAQMQ
ncbi:MAG: extracellular solute-binding protein [Gemmiger sp.]|uniref:extracellular solute-binding protein n=1 Tax=Gemmiger sp. TaxID=2049027 RepID=UPI002E766051|nr:extracellular solute-binding protein [Gemmiger sp.]MEE0710047.1 extracellular solute-binding protein [Gemmiger sp.]